ncbi:MULTISPECIES: histidine phosphatase family protein [unclassified Thioalkalivibrio]|uniref:SixA phosphatase family protein n=1 Tax=unclassified Thioalkalivibrio TaxID=2621013 RepID=UPI00036CAE83|nr:MULTISPECIES: histidine phosphatase family protein [unclassified Thioalkalivibrio]
MKRPDLVLLRHAQSEDPSAFDGPDRDRPLTREGEASAAAMARALVPLLAEPARVWVSPWHRAAQTAAPLARALACEAETVDCLRPGQLVGPELQERLQTEKDGGSIVLVGHEPDLSRLAGRLLGLSGGAAPVAMGKGDACGLGGHLPGPLHLVWHLPRGVLERLGGA